VFFYTDNQFYRHAHIRSYLKRELVVAVILLQQIVNGLSASVAVANYAVEKGEPIFGRKIRRLKPRK
jgi:hypothetical protein